MRVSKAPESSRERESAGEGVKAVRQHRLFPALQGRQAFTGAQTKKGPT
ncbi:hypothetical protein [Candidatus Pantoea multigeneris]|nr:hypothetical protein [Pantoea multigeneris]